MGNAFNRTLYQLVGAAIGWEGRSISNLRGRHDGDVGDGLTYWSPTINLQRDPRWGRNQEVPGEDPYLTGQYSTAFVTGLQHETNSGQRLQGVAGCCKHYLANSLESWNGTDRHKFDARIDDDDLHNYYLPPFKDCVTSRSSTNVQGVMCSYNSVNGVPACANQYLLNTILRDRWNFDGYVVSDCGAIHDIISGHRYAKNNAEASALSKNASVDVNCGGTFQADDGLRKALFEDGTVTREIVQRSFRRMAAVQFRLGLFNASSKKEAAKHPERDVETINSPSHRNLALEAALQSIVLLENHNEFLPLDNNNNEMKSIALIGPHYNATEVFLSNYHGSKCGCNNNEKCQEKRLNKDFSCIDTPLEAISRRFRHRTTQVRSLLGCTVAGENDENFEEELEKATKLAMESDAVVLFLGLDDNQEREELDRTEITLPGNQPKLLRKILEVAGDKTAIVLIHGGSISLGDDATTSQAGSILSAGYGGEAAAEAIARVLFGEYNPYGKLATTWYPSEYVRQIPLTEMGLRVGVGR